MSEASILLLPGTMFGPTRAQGGDGGPERELRIAFANAGVDGLAEMGRRLEAVGRTLAAGLIARRGAGLASPRASD